MTLRYLLAFPLLAAVLTLGDVQAQTKQPAPAKPDNSSSLGEPPENKLRPLTKKCQKRVLEMYTECAPQPPTERCEKVVNRFQKYCLLPPEKETDKGKKKGKKKT